MTPSNPSAVDVSPADAHNLRLLANTTFYAVITMIGTVVSCILVAYGFARFRFPGRDLLFIILISTIFLPATVTLIPTYAFWQRLGLVGTWIPLINIDALTGTIQGELAAEECFREQAKRGLARHHALADALALRAAYISAKGIVMDQVGQRRIGS